MTWRATSDRAHAVHIANCTVCAWCWPSARTKPETAAGMSRRRRAYYAARNHTRRYGHDTTVASSLRITVLPES